MKKAYAIDLKALYLFVYDDFAVYTKDVIEKFNVDRKEALRCLKKLQSATHLIDGEFTDGEGTIGGSRKDYPGKEMLWQCWNTYDSENRTEAEKRIDNALKGVK